MFKNISDWQSNTDLEAGGVPVDLGKGRAILVKRAGGSNRAFKVALADELRLMMGDREASEVSEAELDPVLRKLYADHVVLGWSGFVDENDAPISFSPAAFLELMDLAPDMWIEVRTHAKQRESFQDAALERDKEALGKFSRGNPNGGVSAHA